MQTTPTPDETLAAADRARSRSGIALCLSGGGFRAALFHLGALRRLNELGILSRVDTISAVSGGSVLAAHVAHVVPVWPDPGQPIPEWDTVVAEPFRAFAGRNLRTTPLLHRLLPQNWLQPGTAVEELASRLERELIPTSLPELPARPRYVFSATDMTFAINWIFERERIGDFQAGYMTPDENWSVARAVAASSCFPPVFGPMELQLDPTRMRKGAYRRADRAALVAGLQLTDGGAYDNMALEPVWKSHETVLVSDGGAVFDYDASSTAMQRLMRYPAIVGKQASAIRRRWLIAGLQTGALQGAYWAVSTAPRKASSHRGYSQGFVDEVVSAIRTDLDAFSRVEIGVLENHGYLVADQVIAGRASHLLSGASDPRPPFPELMDDEEGLRDSLQGSEKRTLLGRQ
jgi:NTE family protein